MGSVIGLTVAIGFGVLTVVHSGEPTALEGRYESFGIIVAVESALAGCRGPRTDGHARWMA